MSSFRRKSRFFVPQLGFLEDRTTPTAYFEPLTLSSAGGVLDITLRAHQSEQPLETLVNGTPTSILTSQFLTYAWTLNEGQSSNLSTSGDSFPGPTLKVNRGDTLRIHLENDLQGLTITPPAGGTPVTEEPINNHVHGLHLSPEGNSDNVLLTLPAGEAFVYEYKIAQDQPEGLYWIHNHRHMYTTDQVYRGLSSMLVVGNSASGIAEFASIPDRAMALQYQYLANQGTATQYLQDFTGAGGKPGQQISTNGLLNPTITAGVGQTEVWSFANMSPNKDLSVRLRNTTTNTNLPLILVAQDGNALGAPVTIPATQNVFMAAGSRYSFLVNASDVAGQNVSLVTLDLKGNVTATYVTMTTDATTGNHLATPSTLTSARFFEDLSGPTVEIAENRAVEFSINPNGGGANAQFLVNGEIFPNPNISQPRIGTVEEWVLTNTSTVAHPFHIHVNPFQVMSSFSPTASQPNVTSPQQWYQDVVNVPPALQDSTGKVIAPGRVVIRLKPIDFTGEFVFHCHILPHEDRGMMALVNTLPNTPIYAAGAGPGAQPVVTVYNSLTNAKMTTLLAFDAAFKGGVRTAVADVNNDGISDLILGAGPNGGPRVKVLDGATSFTTTLYNFFAFDPKFTGGVNVSGSDFNGDGYDDVVVGAGEGGGPVVAIFDGKTGNPMTRFFAYDAGFRGGVTVATGDIDGSGFESLVTGPGAGGSAQIRTWQNNHFYKIGETPILPGEPKIMLEQTSQFLAFDPNYRGGVQVATGLNSGATLGGFDRILVGALRASARVTIWEMSTAAEAMAASAMMEMTGLNFELATSFFAFTPEDSSGVQVGSVAISNGSDFLAGTTKGSVTRVKRFSLPPGASQPTLEKEFAPFSPKFDGGASVGGTN